MSNRSDGSHINQLGPMEIRPPKRARFHVSSEESYIRQNQSSLLYIQSLIREIATLGLPSCEGDFLTNRLCAISIFLLNNSIDDSLSVKELHGILLLFLGFFMPDNPTNTAASSYSHQGGATTVNIILEILRCMHNLYQHSSCRAFIAPRERVESYMLLLQLMCGSSDGDYALILTPSHIHFECCKVLDLLVRRDFVISQLLSENRFEVERLLLAFLRLSISEKQPAITDIVRVLQNHSFGPVANFLSRIMIDIIYQKASEERIPLNLCHYDQLFYWKCVLISEDIALPTVSKIVSFVTQFPDCKTFSYDEITTRLSKLQCLHLLKNNIEVSDDAKLVLGALLKCAVNDQVGLDLSLVCLRALLEGKQGDFQQLLNAMKSAPANLMKFLEFNALRCNGLSAIAAAKAILRIIRHELGNLEVMTLKEQFSSISLISDLLCSNIDTNVTEEAIGIVESLSAQQNVHKLSNVLLQKILSAVAKSASDEFATNNIRHGAVRSFWTLVHEHDVHTNLLSRTPKVLETLVTVASTQELSEERTMAFSTLMRLSENACNRRILAKQPGLLSSLIRYTRSISQDRNHQIVTRVDMKKRILLLATAL